MRLSLQFGHGLSWDDVGDSFIRQCPSLIFSCFLAVTENMVGLYLLNPEREQEAQFCPLEDFNVSSIAYCLSHLQYIALLETKSYFT